MLKAGIYSQAKAHSSKPHCSLPSQRSVSGTKGASRRKKSSLVPIIPKKKKMWSQKLLDFRYAASVEELWLKSESR